MGKGGGRYVAAGRCCAAMPLLLLVLVAVCQVDAAPPLPKPDYCYYRQTGAWRRCGSRQQLTTFQPQPPSHHIEQLNRDVISSFMNVQTRADHGFQHLKDLTDAINKIETPRMVIPVLAMFNERNLYCGLTVIPTSGNLEFIMGWDDHSPPSKMKQYLTNVEAVLSEGQENEIFVTPSSMNSQTISQTIWNLEADLSNLYQSQAKNIWLQWEDVDTLDERGDPVRWYLAAIGAPKYTQVSISDEDMEFMSNEFASDSWDSNRVEKWKHYLMWHLLRGTAPFLSQRMAALHGYALKAAPRFGALPTYDLLSMTIGRREWFHLNTRVDEISKHLRSSILHFLPLVEEWWFHDFEYRVYKRSESAAFYQVNTDSDKHILQFLFEGFTQQFHEGLSEKKKTSQFSIVIKPTSHFWNRWSPWSNVMNRNKMSVLLETLQIGPSRSAEVWPTKDQCREALGCGSGDVLRELQVIQIGDGEARDPAHDFAVIGSWIAEWMVTKLALQDDQLKALLDNPETDETDRKTLENDAVFHLLRHSFLSFLKEQKDIGKHVSESQLIGFFDVYQHYHGPIQQNDRS